jgi:hypothetical protein
MIRYDGHSRHACEEHSQCEQHRTRPDELTGWEEHLRDSQGYGDPRRCPNHPHVKMSSDDGMFDAAECGECEWEYEQWLFSQDNPHRDQCYDKAYIAMPRRTMTCSEVRDGDDIPF